MTKRDQKKLLRTFCNQVRDHLLSKSKNWPVQWDGHELRELVAFAFEFERTTLMREHHRRRRDCKNDISVLNLY